MSRVRPPLLVLVLAMASFLLGWLLPVARWIDLPASLLGVVLVAAGLGLSAASSLMFGRVDTNINTFENPTILVTNGWFARSRNPMYLGFLVALFGEAIVVGSLSALLGPVAFFLVAQLHYVPFEEARLRETFGSAYKEYASRVRRWI